VKHFLYVIGEPGSGKSTVVERMTAGAEATDYEGRFAMSVYATTPEVIEIGRRRENFPGTDALALNVQPKVIDWLRQTTARHVLAEGDRLANAAFFDYLIEQEWNLVIARIRVRPETAAARRAQRETRQDETWVESRRTKIDRLGALYPERTLNLWHEDGDTAQLIAALCERSPVAAAFR